MPRPRHGPRAPGRRGVGAARRTHGSFRELVPVPATCARRFPSWLTYRRRVYSSVYRVQHVHLLHYPQERGGGVSSKAVSTSSTQANLSIGSSIYSCMLYKKVTGGFFSAVQFFFLGQKPKRSCRARNAQDGKKQKYHIPLQGCYVQKRLQTPAGGQKGQKSAAPRLRSKKKESL